MRIRGNNDIYFLSKNSLTLQSLLQNSLGSCLLECYDCMIDDLYVLQEFGIMLDICWGVSLHDSFFTVPCFNCMYDQSAPHGVVEASSIFLSSLFPLGHHMYSSWLIGIYSCRYYPVSSHFTN